MARLAIKGHATRGKEVIELLEMMGGKQFESYLGNDITWCYTIINGEIDWDYPSDKYKVFTLEEFLKEFPYKVGDKVLYKTYGIYSRIKSMLWNEEKEQVFYRLDSKKLYVASEDELHPCKEETMDKVSKDVFDANAQCCDIMNRLIKEETMEERENSIVVNIEHKQLKVQSLRFDKTQLVINDEYELKQEDNTYYIVHKQFKYPKTYEECCDIIEYPHNVVGGYKAELLSSFQNLLICRDVYWKIAGDWKFDFEKPCYYLCNEFGSIQKYEGAIDCSAILTFPTKDMRDAFLENFKNLIESCKELL